jgi:hypothetical protein
MDGQDTQTIEQAVTDAPATAETSQALEKEVNQTEQTEAKTETEQQDSEVESEGDEQPDKPRKLSRYDRMKRRMSAMATELDGYRSQFASRESGNDPPKAAEPKEDDYNGDYTSYLADLAAFRAAKRIEERLEARDQADAQLSVSRRSLARQWMTFIERAEEAKTRIPDFDDKIKAFQDMGGKFAPHVIEEVRDSDKGPQLAYFLASNPAIAAELNALNPRDAAREIGRIEASLSLPKPKKQTQAPAPVQPPMGGSAPLKDVYAAAKSDDMAAYIKMRNAEEAKKTR